MRLNNERRCAFLALLLFSLTASAADEGFQWRGFLTAGYTQALSDNRYLSYIDTDPNFFYDALLGIAFSKPLSNTVEVGAQLVAAGSLQSYTPQVDWAHVTYRPNDSLMLRAGRIRFPMWLISDYYYVSYSYPWARPPPEIYNTNILSSFFGALAQYNYNVSPGIFSATIFGGSSPLNIPLVSNFQGQAINTRLQGSFERLIGVTLSYESLNLLLRASYANALAQLNVTASMDAAPLLPGIYTQTPLRAPLTGTENFWAAGLRWRALSNLRLTAEYLGSRLGEGSTGTSTYATAEFPVGMFTPHATMAWQGNSAGNSSYRYALGLNFALTESSMLKFQWDGIDVKRGYGPLFSPSNGVVHVISSNFDMVF